jgi:hypothetical protein
MELPTHVRVPKKMEIESRADMELAVGSGLCSRAGSLIVASPCMTSSAALGHDHLYKRALKGFAGSLVKDLTAHAW